MSLAKIRTHVPKADYGEAEILYEDHVIQVGGTSDGYCYGHQTFDCLDSMAEDPVFIRALVSAEHITTEEE